MVVGNCRYFCLLISRENVINNMLSLAHYLAQAPLKLRPYGAIQICLLLLLFFMPRYSVPEDLEITHKEKKNYNGCNGLAGSERVLK